MEFNAEFFQGGMASLMHHSLVQRLVLALVVLGLAKLLLILRWCSGLFSPLSSSGSRSSC